MNKLGRAQKSDRRSFSKPVRRNVDKITTEPSDHKENFIGLSRIRHRHSTSSHINNFFMRIPYVRRFELESDPHLTDDMLRLRDYDNSEIPPPKYNLTAFF